MRALKSVNFVLHVAGGAVEQKFPEEGKDVEITRGWSMLPSFSPKVFHHERAYCSIWFQCSAR